MQTSLRHSDSPSSPLLAGRTVLAPIAWGTTYVTITELLPPERPLLVAALRVLPAGLLLVALGSGWRPRGGHEWRHTALLATTNFAVFFPLLVVAAYRLPGGIAAASGGLQPLLVAMLTWALSGRRPRPADLVIGILAAVGVAMVVVGPGAAFDPVGVLAAVGANVSFATGVVLTKRFAPPRNRIGATGWQFVLASAVLVPLALAVEGPPPPMSATNLAGFAYLSLAGTALAFVAWFDGIRRLPVAAPPLLGLAAPVTGAAAGWLLLGENLSPLQLVGFAVTIGAIARGATLGASDGSAAAPVTPTPHASAHPAGAAAPSPARAGVRLPCPPWPTPVTTGPSTASPSSWRCPSTIC